MGRKSAMRGDHEQASEQDIAKSLLLMISNNIGQVGASSGSFGFDSAEIIAVQFLCVSLPYKAWAIFSHRIG